jgi:uncharacterized protein YndB with AHSA1/START domain
MPNIHHELLIGAAIGTVYRAITSPEGLSAWWTPDAQAVPELNSIARFPFGPAYFKEMKITELEPPIGVNWICIKGAEEWVGTTLSFKLEHGDRGALLSYHPELQDQIRQVGNREQTLLILHHDDWKSYSPMFAECSYTWGQFLRSLKLLCETGKGRPWPNQHRIEP